MEQISVCDQFPPLSAKYPWLVAQSLELDTQDLFFCTINNELPHYRCRIPHLLGERIWGFFHGWVILSNHPNNNKWSLLNQVTSRIISLPTLILKDGNYESIGECCLSAPPDDPSSILLLTRTNKSSFVFFRLNSKRNKFRWTEMSYAYQIRRLTLNCKFVRSLTCCNGKVYALSTGGSVAQYVMLVDIVVKQAEVVIKLMVFGPCPVPSSRCYGDTLISYLKGSCTELFSIQIYMDKETKNAHTVPINVHIFKSDMTRIDWEVRECLKSWDLSDFISVKQVPEDYFEVIGRSDETWEELDDLNDAYFFVDLARDHSVSYGRVISSELGGFIHIRGKTGETIYSYHVKNDTISVFPVPFPLLPTSHLLMWEYRLKDDRGEAKCIVDSKVETKKKNEILLRSDTDDKVKFNQSYLLNTPFNILETIIEFCVGIEYMSFRATCKQCHLAAPSVKWCNNTSLKRLQTYSVVSPWLMVVDERHVVMTFTDPVLGDNYFMKKSCIDIPDHGLYCSRFGWLLFNSLDLKCLVLFNPFTNDIQKLPDEDPFLDSLCFSAPPTSPDCMVVGFIAQERWRVDILFVNQERTWRSLDLGPDPHSICFSTFYDGDLYVLCKDGELIVISNLGKDDYSLKLVEAEVPKGSCTQHFLTNCNQHLLLVSVGGKYGGSVEVFKLNESQQEWEKIDNIGKHMIYISGITSLCIEAKVAKMENKIFFPRLHTKNREVVLYSLDTCKYHTFDGENLQEHAGDLFGTTYPCSHNAWIEPSWS